MAGKLYDKSTDAPLHFWEQIGTATHEDSGHKFIFGIKYNGAVFIKDERTKRQFELSMDDLLGIAIEEGIAE